MDRPLSSFLSLALLMNLLRLVLLTSLTAMLDGPSLVRASEPPDWWIARGVIAPEHAADDYAVANLGQLKHLASQAAAELNASLPDGAGSAINDLIAS